MAIIAKNNIAKNISLNWQSGYGKMPQNSALKSPILMNQEVGLKTKPKIKTALKTKPKIKTALKTISSKPLTQKGFFGKLKEKLGSALKKFNTPAKQEEENLSIIEEYNEEKMPIAQQKDPKKSILGGIKKFISAKFSKSKTSANQKIKDDAWINSDDESIECEDELSFPKASKKTSAVVKQRKKEAEIIPDEYKKPIGPTAKKMNEWIAEQSEGFEKTDSMNEEIKADFIGNNGSLIKNI